MARKKKEKSNSLEEMPKIAKKKTRLPKDPTIALGKYFAKNIKGIYKNIESGIKDQNVLLKEIKTVMECAEETLMNVLMAIRQNEYLQAWYPAQNGLPSKMIVGKHPYSDVPKEE